MGGTAQEKQFLLVVRNQKGFPVFQLFDVATNYIVPGDPNFGTINGGATLNESLIEPNGTPFTLITTVP